MRTYHVQEINDAYTFCVSIHIRKIMYDVRNGSRMNMQLLWKLLRYQRLQ